MIVSPRPSHPSSPTVAGPNSSFMASSCLSDATVIHASQVVQADANAVWEGLDGIVKQMREHDAALRRLQGALVQMHEQNAITSPTPSLITPIARQRARTVSPTLTPRPSEVFLPGLQSWVTYQAVEGQVPTSSRGPSPQRVRAPLELARPRQQYWVAMPPRSPRLAAPHPWGHAQNPVPRAPSPILSPRTVCVLPPDAPAPPRSASWSAPMLTTTCNAEPAATNRSPSPVAWSPRIVQRKPTPCWRPGFDRRPATPAWGRQRPPPAATPLVAPQAQLLVGAQQFNDARIPSQVKRE